MIQWIDAHCHLGFLPHDTAGSFAQKAREGNTFLYSVTVTPDEYVYCSQLLKPWDNVAVGVGLHPWWVESEDSRVQEVVGLIDKTRFVGEVGLDFGSRHAHTADLQIQAFTSVARACGEQGNKVISIHSVAAASKVLDILEQTGCLDSCTCIFHWFLGSSAELVRARKAGCYFSVGGRMLSTRRGAEYVREIPRDRLLVETDLPSAEEEIAWSGMQRILQNTYEQVNVLCGEDRSESILANGKFLVNH